VAEHRIFTSSVASVYPHYVAKAERKGRTREEVDAIIRWLTGHSPESLRAEFDERTDFETFFAQAPRDEPGAWPDQRHGVRRARRGGGRTDDARIRYLDKLVDELAGAGRWRRSCGRGE
jgi:hypothetical protein